MNVSKINLWLAFILVILAVASSVAQKSVKNEKPKSNEKSKNILVFFAFGSYSMRISVWPLVEDLARNGHNVTFISSYKPRFTTDLPIHEITPKGLAEWNQKQMDDEFDVVEARTMGGSLGKVMIWFTFPSMLVEGCQRMFDDPEVLEWFPKQSYDLVIVDTFNDCGYALANYYKAKTITFSTCAPLARYYDAFGIPDESSWITDMMFDYPVFKPTFFNRVVSAVNPVVWKFIQEYHYFPQLEQITRKVPGLEKFPGYKKLEMNTTLTFITTHYAQEYARVLPPNVIPIGGLVMGSQTKKKNNPLPKDFEDFIQKGKQGFIYVSFGTVFEFTKLTKEMQDNFINAFLSFPHIQFIWKASKGVGRDMPANFMISKWVPQQDILAHPKLLSFITHSGMGSTTEAVHHGVPLICFPQLADQDYNSYFVEERKVGIRLEVTTFTTEEFKTAIKSIIEDDTYKNNMKKMSSLFKDRPMSPSDTALWWTEFVLRHDKEEIHEFLRVRNLNEPWFVRRQLDVWLFVGLVLTTLITIPVFVTYKLASRLLCGNKGKKSNSSASKLKTN